MIILLGATGYVGSTFAKALTQRGLEFLPLSIDEIDCTRFDLVLDLLRQRRPEFLINCAGYTGRPNVDACEIARADTLQGNVLLPLTLSHACQVAQVPWGHVSSGCVFSGAKIVQDGKVRAEKDLTKPALRELIERDRSVVRGFTEQDTPNFSYRDPPCSFYSGSKALGEEAIAGDRQNFLWRLRIPFDEVDGPRNYLSKLQNYPKVYDNYNSISQLTDFANACVELWTRRAPFGVYNVTNPGFVSSHQVIGLIEKHLKPNRKFEFWTNDEEFYRIGAKTPRSNCVLDASKLLATGVKMRPVEEALDAALRGWKKAK